MVDKWIEEWIKKMEFVPLTFDHIFLSYLPNKDRNKKQFDVQSWETKLLKIQGRLFGGATSYPTRGSFRTLDASGNIVTGVMVEKTRMVTSFVQEKEYTEEAIKEISDFLLEFGIKTNQETVAFVVDGVMYWIDMPKKK